MATAIPVPRALARRAELVTLAGDEVETGIPRIRARRQRRVVA
jgi:hypothetical protein